MESQTERTEEDIHEQAHHAGQKWILWVATSAAILAALAAVTVLLAGHHADEAMMIQQQASDKWNEYQDKKLKSMIIASKDELLKAQGKAVSSEDEKYLTRHRDEEQQLRDEADALTKESQLHKVKHEPLAMGVTMFQVAIAIAAISVLSKRPVFWFVSLGFGVVGVAFLVRGVM